MADHRSRAKPATRSRKLNVSKKRRARVAKKDEHSVKAGEVRIVERRVSPHASDIEMMQRVKDELEDLKTA